MPHHHQTNSQTNLTFLKSNYKFKRREMPMPMPMPICEAIFGLPATSAEARTAANQLTPAMSPQTSAAAAATAATSTTKVATSEGRAAETAAAAKQQLATATGRKCRTILSLFIVNAWSFLQELANCCWLDDDHWAAHRRDVNAGQLRRRRRRTTIATDEEVSMAREHQQRQQKLRPHQRHQQHEHLPGSSPVKSMRCTGAGATSTSTSTVAGQPLMALLIGLLLLDLRLAAAGTCWQTHLGSGKCGQVFSTNITRAECCGASQSFSFTDRELSSVEYFFATAIGGGVECSPCMESCKGFKCGPNKKCVKRKGRPKCVCAPECGAALRRKQQPEQQPGMPPRDSRSLSSENSNTNLGLDGSQRQHIADNQRKLQQQQHQQQQQQQHQNQVASPSPRHRRLLIIDSSNLPDRSRSRGGGNGGGAATAGSAGSAGRVEMTGYERRRQRNSHGNGKHLTRSMTTGANDSSKADKTPAQSPDSVAVPVAPVEALTQPPSRRNLANANEPANDINRQSDNARLRHQHQHQHSGRQRMEHAPHPDNGRRDRHSQRQRHRLRLRQHKDPYAATSTEVEANSTVSGSGSRFRLQHGSETAASSDFANAHDLAILGGIYEHSSSSQNLNPSPNPVCGSDGRTYNSECQLRKRACRTNNAQLEVAYRGHCKNSCNGVQCLDGLSCVEDQYMMPHCIACQIECPWDNLDLDANSSGYDERQAVCGVDGKTYRSACDINRMICQIGRSIAVAYPGPCRAGRVSCADIKCGPKDNCLVDLQTGLPRCVSCRHKCPRKQQRPLFQVHKICGYNNHTYSSWCEMHKHSCDSRYFIGVKSQGSC